MPNCSVKQCSARKSQNQPQLTLHRFPKSVIMRKRWLDVIGMENINPRHKNWYVCSLHFEDKCFNRTLDIVRLREDAVPSLSIVGRQGSDLRLNIPVLSEINIPESFTSLKVGASVSNQDTVILPSTASTVVRQGSDLKLNIPELSEINTQKSCTSLKVGASVSDQNTLILPSTASTVIQTSAKIENLTKTLEEQRRKIKNLHEKVRRRDNKIANLTHILEDLQKRKYINTEEAILLEECAGPQDFLRRQISKAKGLPIEKKYGEEIRKFALTLHFYSPKAYNFIRNKYNTCLPHTRTLRKWYQNVDAEPGFTEEAFKTLKIKSENSNHQLVCALVMDEMAIRKGLGKWDPSVQKFSGRVNFGSRVCTSDSEEEATQCLVLLLTNINGSWKLPIGYFLVTSLTGEQKCELVRTAIMLCEKVNVKIVSLTCDGPVSNFSMFSCLGCNLFKNQTVTSFKYSKSNVQAFIDPCHAVKLIRNAFGELRVFYDASGRKIDFTFVEKLLQLQEKEGLHLATKITKAHIEFEKQKMKVRLATQLFSSSVADAIEHCRSKLSLNEFENSEGTVNFINIINDVFDVLNSHSIRPPGWKKAMCPENIGLIQTLFDTAILYINNLKLSSGQRVIESRRKTGFIGLIICMNSAIELYESLVNKEKLLKYIPLYKVSQDHVELFFAAIRARGGWNNNPNAVQFRAAYKKLLIRSEIRDGGLGNCIPLEQITILTCSSKNPIKTINDLTQKSSFIEIPEDHSDLYEEFVELLILESTEYTISVLEYIAGYIARKLSNIIKCVMCVAILLGPVNVNSLIYQKSRGGLKYASDDVLNILKKCENLIKPQLESKSKPENYYLYIFKFLVEFYDTKDIFVSNDIEHDINHRLLLIKSVIKTYLDLRYRYYSKKSTDKVSHRTFLNKLTLFRNE